MKSPPFGDKTKDVLKCHRFQNDKKNVFANHVAMKGPHQNDKKTSSIGTMDPHRRKTFSKPTMVSNRDKTNASKCPDACATKWKSFREVFQRWAQSRTRKHWSHPSRWVRCFA